MVRRGQRNVEMEQKKKKAKKKEKKKKQQPSLEPVERGPL